MAGAPFAPFNDPTGAFHGLEPHERLIAAVVRQALSDATHRDFLIRTSALEFLRGGPALSEVCAVAGLSPQVIVRLAARHMEETAAPAGPARPAGIPADGRDVPRPGRRRKAPPVLLTGAARWSGFGAR